MNPRSLLLYFLGLAFFMGGPLSLEAQQFLDPREAKRLFKDGNHLDAIPLYKKLIRKDSEKVEYWTNLGICYLKTNIDKSKAVKYLEQASKMKGHDDEVIYYLGRAYMYELQFDKALAQFKKYKENSGWGGKDDVGQQIEDCNTAKELMKYPLDVSFENMGPAINSKYPDYYPYVAKDESVLVFTSRRKSNIGSRKEFDGYYSSDIWFVEDEGEGLKEAENAGRKVNTLYDEQAVGLSDDGEIMYVYIDHVKEYGDIYRSRKDRLGYGKIEKLGANVNKEDVLETSASLSSDGKTLLFASQRDGGQGGIDLYMSKKLPTGEWAKPQNLGPKINTSGDEGFPTLSSDNKTLYFCSNGHPGMGGYDIFTATWKDREGNSWSEPKNIGYPINTPNDNRTISYTEDGEHAYVSMLRDDTHGSLDIYKVTFNKVAERPAIYKMRIPSRDTANPYITDAYVTILDKNFEVVGQYAANEGSGAYTMALPPGEYTLEIEAEGYPLYEEKLKVTEEETEKTLIEKMVNLKKGE